MKHHFANVERRQSPKTGIASLTQQRSKARLHEARARVHSHLAEMVRGCAGDFLPLVVGVAVVEIAKLAATHLGPASAVSRLGQQANKVGEPIAGPGRHKISAAEALFTPEGGE